MTTNNKEENQFFSAIREINKRLDELEEVQTSLTERMKSNSAKFVDFVIAKNKTVRVLVLEERANNEKVVLLASTNFQPSVVVTRPGDTPGCHLV